MLLSFGCRTTGIMLSLSITFMILNIFCITRSQARRHTFNAAIGAGSEDETNKEDPKRVGFNFNLQTGVDLPKLKLPKLKMPKFFGNLRNRTKEIGSAILPLLVPPTPERKRRVKFPKHNQPYNNIRPAKAEKSASSGYSNNNKLEKANLEVTAKPENKLQNINNNNNLANSNSNPLAAGNGVKQPKNSQATSKPDGKTAKTSTVRAHNNLTSPATRNSRKPKHKQKSLDKNTAPVVGTTAKPPSLNRLKSPGANNDHSHDLHLTECKDYEKMHKSNDIPAEQKKTLDFLCNPSKHPKPTQPIAKNVDHKNPVTTVNDEDDYDEYDYLADDDYQEKNNAKVTNVRTVTVGSCGSKNYAMALADRQRLSVFNLTSQMDTFNQFQDSEFGEWPWQAIVRSGSKLCGGVIIGDQFILASAHCFHDANIDIRSQNAIGTFGIDAIVGLSRLKGGQHHTIYKLDEKCHSSRKSNDTNFSIFYDYVLFRTMNKIKLSEVVQPLCLPNLDRNLALKNRTNKVCFATGWGEIDVDHNIFPDRLQKLRLFETDCSPEQAQLKSSAHASQRCYHGTNIHHKQMKSPTSEAKEIKVFRGLCDMGHFGGPISCWDNQISSWYLEGITTSQHNDCKKVHDHREGTNSESINKSIIYTSFSDELVTNIIDCMKRLIES